MTVSVILLSVFIFHGSAQIHGDVVGNPVPELIAGLFADFKIRSNKHYATIEEEMYRFKTFVDNFHFMTTENSKGTNPYVLGVGPFADMERSEYKAKALGYIAPPSNQTMSNAVHMWNGEPLADTVDWNQQGAVTPVKNQGQCGSCWSFSTTGALEGAWKISGHALVSLSEEQFVQCDGLSHGCGGGSMYTAFGWAKAQGLCAEASYPYTSGGGVTGTCPSQTCGGSDIAIPAGGVTAAVQVTPGSKESMMSAVMQQPVFDCGRGRPARFPALQYWYYDRGVRHEARPWHPLHRLWLGVRN